MRTNKEKAYRAATNHGVERTGIPHRRDAMLWDDDKKQPHPRNVNLRRVWEIGRAERKVESGYHCRSLAEPANFIKLSLETI
jgi:hypothetical protein